VPGRLLSLDAYRGLVMLALALEGAVPAAAQKFPNSQLLQVLARQFVHVDWEGGVFWDLIQPSFIFCIGVAMTFSYFSRRTQGQSARRVALHVMYRSAVLVLLGWLLGSMFSSMTQFRFDEILAQIGLAYPFAYLFVGKPLKVQLTASGIILLACWAAFAAYPLPAPTFDFAALGIHDGGGPFTGFYAHWNKYTNVAYAFDRWFLNLFPQPAVWLANRTYNTTLDFVPSIVTMVLGVMAGDILRSSLSSTEKLARLLVAGVCGVAGGLILGATVCPIIKALWTPSWVLASGGACFLFLALAYWMADIRGWKALMFPLVVIGANSLAMYLMIRLCKAWIWTNLEIHLGGTLHLSHLWALDFVLGAFIMWLVCLWMYRHKIFIRI
jgi:heparan-alpha-glucosaminide N-acetyltransferase